MTVTMTSKNQVTIPKKITNVLGLGKGAMFNVEVSRNRIELIPLETREKEFTEEEYRKLEALASKQRGTEKRVTGKLINKLMKGKI